MIIIGIDPGPISTAFCTISRNNVILDSDKWPNSEFIAFLQAYPKALGGPCVALESIQSYGMAVGREVFDTCYMIGRIIQVCIDRVIDCTLYPRPEYTRRICGVGKINDAVLRQALLLRFGGDRKGEPLAMLKGNSDKRSAFAVAIYHLDLMNGGLLAAQNK